MEELSALLNEVNERYMQQIYDEYEKVCEKCGQRASSLKVRQLLNCIVSVSAARLLENAGTGENVRWGEAEMKYLPVARS